MGFTSAAWLIAVSVAVQPAGVAPTLDRRIALLDELTSVTQRECVGHDELIARYDAAIDGAAEEGEAGITTMLRVGRQRAGLLRFVQTDRRDGWDRFPGEVLVLRTYEGAEAVEIRDELDALERSVADAVADGLPDPCHVQPTPLEPAQEVPPEATAPEQTILLPPPPRVSPTQPAPPIVNWTRTEKALLGSGTVAGTAGFAAMLVGIVGPIAAKNNSRISAEGPSETQQLFLNETVPRRATIALSLGSVALAAGVGLVVGGLVSRRARRAHAGR